MSVRAEVTSLILMDLPTAAAFLCVSRNTLYAWVHARKVPFRKHGSRLVFCQDELLRWSESRAVCVAGPSYGMTAPDRSLATRRKAEIEP